MNTLGFCWKNLGITQKFARVFTLLLAILMLIAITGLLSSYNIRRAEEKIRKSTHISKHILEMDLGMERSYRLHGDFFLHFQHIGLQKAHELYAQPSIREIARVIKLSNELQQRLFVSREITIAEINIADINLYLASAKRFADTSIESYQLITERAAPVTGLEEQLLTIGRELQTRLAGHQDLPTKFAAAYSFYKDYLIHRQRFLMQSSLNKLSSLSTAIEQDLALSSSQKKLLFSRIDTFRDLADKLLAVDLTLTGKLRDFYLQRQAIAPISKTLAELTREQVRSAEKEIEWALTISKTVIPLSTLIAILILIYISRLINTSITRNVINLTRGATAFSEGNLEARVTEESQDELGRLATIFNTMATRLKDLIENLETKVARRTEDLARSEERFRQLVRELPNIAVQGFDEQRHIIYWNKASETVFGYSAEEAIGRKIDELISPKDRQANFCESLTNWYENDVAIPPAECMLMHKSGSEIPVYVAYVMQADSSGQKTMYCIGVDLTELKTAQSREQKSATFYRQLFDHSSSGVVVCEPIDNGRDFIIRDFNHAAETIEQISKADILGHTITEVFPGVNEMGLLDSFRQVVKTGEPVIQPFAFYKDERIEGWRSNRIYKLPSGELVTVYDDVTSQKQAEKHKQVMEQSLQRAQKMEAIGLMAGGIAHDLNNTLSAIVGYPELLLMQLPEDSNLRKPLRTIKEAGERAAAVVADLLTVARGVASTRQSANLNVLVQECLHSPEFSEIQSKYPQIRVKNHLAADIKNISCSPIHVKKCIMNLIANGVESMGKTGTLTLATRSTVPDQEVRNTFGLQPIPHSMLRVSDTSPGIPEKDLPHIFEPFYTKRAMGKTGGTGLGLSVVWNTMKDHEGGVVAISSSKGTTFSLYFPETRESDSANTELQQTALLQGDGETILVVDDEPQQCCLAREILEHYGYRVECRESGEKAVGYLQDNRVDLVILDMIMAPGINGRQTYAEITKIHPGQKAIIASGFSESDDVKATLEMGADAFIKKPYSIQELAATVKNALQRP